MFLNKPEPTSFYGFLYNNNNKVHSLLHASKSQHFRRSLTLFRYWKEESKLAIKPSTGLFSYYCATSSGKCWYLPCPSTFIRCG
jgi:hypothetical protein